MGRALGILFALLFALPASASAGQLQAGVGDVDASWHVGAGSGQYATDGARASDSEFDPHGHTTRRVPSYGLQSRLRARALVVQGPDGKRVAIVKQDLYLPQDLLWRRAAQLIEAKNIGITRETFSMVATHNHSSPYYSSPSAGVWVFQDAFDVRFFNYYAERLAAAVEQAATNMKPVRVGGAVRTLADIHRSVPGEERADDDTPAGFPQSYGDHDVIVVRFDDISDPENPKPLANLVNYSVHPETLDGNDLISADYIGPLERMLDRESGAMTIFSQGAVGGQEPERSQWHEPSERRQYYHGNYAESERMAREIADQALGAFGDVARGIVGPGGDQTRLVPFQTDSEVDMVDRWFPGPVSHPVPTVSGCRTDKTFQGDPRIPGPPECLGADYGGFATFGFDPGLSTDTFQEHGIPVPENISLPSYGGLEESVSIHLQAFKIGDILFTLCSCEQWHEQSKNIKTRTNRTQGDQHNGYLWDCQPNGTTITQRECDKMRAQVLNDAKGWNDPGYAPYAESEPTKLEDIKGNYTHSELSEDEGYKLTVAIGMANDYNGYIATYREYQRGDHYRKSLTGWGPHSSDYLATRLVDLGGQLSGGPAPPAETLDGKTEVDMRQNDAKAEALGRAGAAYVQAYEATLPSDSGAGETVEQPEDSIERFDAVTFTWTGGSNWTDMPEVEVQRQTDQGWVDFADQSGEIPVTVKYPAPSGAADYVLGQRWEWTAHFEAFASDIETGRGRATPAGTYRFVVKGLHRQGSAVVGYDVESEEFEVKPWSGITVDDFRTEPDGAVSFKVGPRRTIIAGDEIGPIDYPDSYEVSRRAKFIRNNRVALRDRSNPNRITWFCFTCTFRPWLDTGNAASATVTVVDADGIEKTVPAHEEGGRWVTDYKLAGGEVARVAAGAVVDAHGNFNGAGTDLVGAG